MKVEIPAIAVVLLIVALHTIIHHLLNWGFRVVAKLNDDQVMIVLMVITLFELLGVTALLSIVVS